MDFKVICTVSIKGIFNLAVGDLKRRRVSRLNCSFFAISCRVYEIIIIVSLMQVALIRTRRNKLWTFVAASVSSIKLSHSETCKTEACY